MGSNAWCCMLKSTGPSPYSLKYSRHSEMLITGECGWNCKVHVSHAEDKRCVLIIEDKRINV